ncbi:MAG TPA: Ig-like domain-containing protein [Pyrinomonadaceae bacterium]|nr:Ig-like domain-containing protein [Pyrinomonadaceae bacterium]
MQSYNDSFEGTAINPFWTAREQFGSLSLSTEQSRSGAQSVKLSSTGGGQREIRLKHTFPSALKGSFSIYFYDAAPGQETLYEKLYLSHSAMPNQVAAIGTQDFDAYCYSAVLVDAGGTAGGPNGTCGVYPQTSTTNVNRTQGWRRLEINVTANSVTFAIDGQQVFSGAGDYSFDTVEIGVSGPFWRPDTAAYFDDFSFSPAPQVQNGRIAFVNARSGNLDIYTVNPNGTGERRLTTNGGGDLQPSYSLDGKLISFSTNRHGNGDIYVVNADGTGERRVTSSPQNEGGSALSPDATKIAFTRRSGITDNLYTVDVDGTGEQQLTFNSGLDISLDEPSYSRDGSLIAFSKRVNSSPNSDIYVINADGTGERQVTSRSSAEFYPNFLPDGRIVFADTRNGITDLYVVNADGTGERRITNGIASNTEPAVSPDGTRIAFRTSRNRVSGVYTVALDGTNEQLVVAGAEQPSWGGAEATPTPTPTPTPPNTPPVANGRALSTAEDTALPLTLPASDADGDALTYTVVSAPANGTLTGAAPALVYAPAPNYNGPDSFTFKVNDGKADSNLATVSINVTPVNDAPAAADDAYPVVGDLSLSAAAPGVLANDADVEGGALTAAAASGPAHGTLALNANGSFVYTPAAGYVGPDSFTYRASDGLLQSVPATVRLDVTAPVCSAAPSGQIAWYPGNGNGDDLIAGRNVTRKNGADWAAGKVAQAFRFDNPGNSNEVFYTTGPSVGAPYEQLTVRAWLYPTEHGHTSSGFGKTVISRTNGDGFALRLYNGQIEADLRLTSGTGTGPLNIFTGTVVPLNRWSHVAITYDGAQIKAYLDGQLVGAQAATGRIRNSANSTTCTMIGNEPNPPCSIQGGGEYGWNGLIDEVEVFSRALSAAEIQGSYQASSAGTCTSAATTTAVQSATARYSPADQSLTLRASVTGPAGTVNSGSVQFTVTSAADDLVGTPVNAPVMNGTAEAVYTLPGGTSPQALTISASYGSPAGEFQGSHGEAVLMVTKAVPTVSVTVGTFTYDGRPHPAAGTVTGAEGQSLGTPAFAYTPGGANAPVAAGTYQVLASFAGDANHEPASDTATIIIDKATSTVIVTAADATYDGQPHGATAVATAAGGLEQPLAVTYAGRNGTDYAPSRTPPTDAGSYTASASFAGDSNHDGDNASADFTISKAAAIVSVTPYSVTFDGRTHTSTGKATGVNNAPLSGLDLTATTHTGAGTYDDTWTFTDPTGNYNDAAGTVTNTIAKAAPTLTVSCPPGVIYTGEAQTPCTANVTGAGGLNQPVSVTYQNNINAGRASANAAYAGGPNHLGGTGEAAFIINKAASVTVVTFEAGPYVYRGLAFTAKAEMAGTGGTSVPVTVSYTGDCTNVTVADGCTATATYEGDANHDGSSDAKSITITKATPTLHWADPAEITYGTPLGAPHLNATADVPGVFDAVAGTFGYTPAPGDVLGAGAHTLHVEFVPTDAANFDGASKDVTLNVTKATLTVRADDKAKTYGEPAVTFTATYAGLVNGEQPSSLAGPLVFDFEDTNATGAGTYAVSPSGLSSPNYSVRYAAGTFTVSKADQTVVWDDPVGVVYGTRLSAAQLNATVTVAGPSAPGSVSYSPGAGHVLNAGEDQPLTVNVAGTDNYNPAFGTVRIDVAKATPIITWETPAAIAFGVALSGEQLNATASHPAVSGPLSGTAVEGSFAYAPAAGAVLPVGNNTLSVLFSPADTANYTGAAKSVVQRVNYVVQVLFDQTRAHVSGSTIPIRLQLSDAFGGNLSSPDIVVAAIGVRKISDAAWGTPEDAGNSDPDPNFRYAGGAYAFNLKTTGLTTGTYELGYAVGNDPTVYTLQFQIR